MSHKINVITLGCSKNVVDSEFLMRQLDANHFKIVHDEDDTDAKTIIINTCGFINDAKQESIDTILSFVEARKRGDVEHLYVMGCLSQRYLNQLKKEIPDVDQYFGVNSFQEIVATLAKEVQSKNKTEINYKTELVGERLISTPKHYSYLKISEGCDRSCSFCAIPLIRGKHISKPIEELVAETMFLVKQGVKEINLIAQDLSYYGLDIYKQQKLSELLQRLSDIKNLEWIRLHYAYPANFPLDVLKVMNERENICKYLDIPIQHISDNVLKLMRRGHGSQQTKELIERIRNEVPGIALRTTILVGHPQESKDDFNQLLDYVKQTKFDRLGVFTYSPEEDTHSFINYKDNVSEKTKLQRADLLMQAQQSISQELNLQKIGRILKVIIDRSEEDFFYGRTEFDSPEVDNEVLIEKSKHKLEIGKFYQVKINDADEFDLIGEVL